ncbi:TIGR03769 domain-containing protein [Psychromicrobium lacuslunae]|uniref:Surface-anchored protein n=1 Tax=Psychromicrobium lacuslunae TaxID=1618207 RepID=A0A0D4C0Q7_9MICC|nr:TIGR03769 domain-containing protein [Psychromicrobium lacuslunae]AJT42163.1 hypothetical protein UM93_12795 [Psychromicrobium lacuslunae]
MTISHTLESSPTTKRFSRTGRRAGIAATVFAGIAALTLAAGAPAQAATVITEGHIDVVRASISSDGSKLVLGTNDENKGNYYTAAQASSVEFDVTKKEGTNWIIPASQTGNELFTGFAGSGNEAPGADSGEKGLYTKLAGGDHIKFTVTPAASNPGTLSLNFPSTTGVVTAGNSYTVALKAGEDEAFHAHPKWTFSAKGTYSVTVTASNPEGKVANSGAITLKFVTK